MWWLNAECFVAGFFHGVIEVLLPCFLVSCSCTFLQNGHCCHERCRIKVGIGMPAVDRVGGPVAVQRLVRDIAELTLVVVRMPRADRCTVAVPTRPTCSSFNEIEVSRSHVLTKRVIWRC